MIDVREITATDAYPLRRTVLRTGTVSNDVAFDGDDGGFHLGAFDGDELVAISSWLPIDDATYRLRGMATAPNRRGAGIGAVLLAAGIDKLEQLGGRAVVANARVDALDFYLRHGFTQVGDVYLDATTGLPHQRIRLATTPRDPATDSS